jgi:hypothetical protein
MRKASMLIVICTLMGLTLTLVARQAADLPPIMKEVGPSFQNLRQSIDAKSAADVERSAARLQTLFTQAQGVFKALKAQDAVDMAKANAESAGAVARAAKAGNFEAAATSAAAMQKNCKSCHDIHREQLPDKTYRFKSKN